MKKIEFIKNVLLSQDMGEKAADEVIKRFNSGDFQLGDPISEIITNTVNANFEAKDFDQIEDDIKYAIDQLRRALKYCNEYRADKWWNNLPKSY